MIGIGNFHTRDCHGVSRRAFLQAGTTLPFAAGLTGLSGRPASAKNGAASAKNEGTAKSVLVLWLHGGPSHVDLFDPKPKADISYRGPFGAIQTREAGIHYSELLPLTAARSHLFSLVRTNVNYEAGHRPASSIMMTGKQAPDGGEDRSGKPGQYPPHFGSILARHRGSAGLPGFISLARGPIGDGVGPVFGYGGGKWGKGHVPFRVSCSAQGDVSIQALELPDGLSPMRLTDRRNLLAALDTAKRKVDTKRFLKWDGDLQQAYSLLTSTGTSKAFDLTQETHRTRDSYGHTSFGQSALLGRRLVEAGVPYVQVNWSQFVEIYAPYSANGWDTHADNFGLLTDWHGPLLDRVVSALLDDMHDRGLLDQTLVVVMGEFGRTPKINNIGSRDHWPQCYFSLWAGGGIQPGRVVGESDRNGEHPLTSPIYPPMVGTTILELAGMATADRAELKVLEGGRVIDELL